MGKANQKGRSKSRGQFFALSHSMAKSEAFKSLSGPAVKILIELMTRHNGQNNGDLSVSNGEAARLLHMSKTTANKAMHELREKGFIKQITPGERLGRKAATYAVTFEFQQIPKHYAATHDYRKWSPKTKKENLNAGINSEHKAILRSDWVPQITTEKDLRSP